VVVAVLELWIRLFNQYMEVLSLAAISDSDVQDAINQLRRSKSLGPNGIPGFVISGCTENFGRVLKYNFNFSLYQYIFPSLWKQATIAPINKKWQNFSSW
jgi:hypothetical protein